MMVSRTWILYEMPQVLDLLDAVYTFLAFCAACFVLLGMVVSYFAVNFIRDTWVNFLEKRFPDLEFVRRTSVRSAVDTHRNMGIITLLVTVKGRCDPLMIKKRLNEDILDKRQNDRRYVYRHLRMTLTTRWGRYAWQDMLPFNLDNHLIFTSPFYRGRPISQLNIQECVSETVSKYLVTDFPPWQITVMPSSSDKYYMLIRIHHMLLSPQGLDLGDLLLLSYDRSETPQSKSHLETDVQRSLKRFHPFQGLYRQPKSVPILLDHLTEMFTNNWNEFLSTYDVIENPSVLKSPTLRTICAISLISCISLAKQMTTHWTLSRGMVRREMRQRQLTWRLMLSGAWNTLNPISLTINSVRTCFSLLIVVTIKLPLLLVCELRSVWMINDESYSDTSYIKSLISGWAIVKDALKETLYYARLAYNGPRIIIEELLLNNHNSAHQLQAVSLCGRKVVSWSDPVPLDMIHQIERATGATACEIFMSATSASLRDYLLQFTRHVPDSVLTTARYFPLEQLMQTSQRSSTSTTGGGVLCLALPTRNPFGHDEDPVTELRAVQQMVLKARLKQPALYLASLWQLEHGLITQVLPSPIVRLILNVLSRRFSVTLSEVGPLHPMDTRKRYLWGQEVEDLMYWRPPQANICMSLTLITFGDTVRLGVMTDALLSPQHSVISAAFSQRVSELAHAAGVNSNLRNLSFLSDDSDTPGASQSSHTSTLSSSSLDLDFDSRTYSDDDNNVNNIEYHDKFHTHNKLHFNIPS